MRQRPGEVVAGQAAVAPGAANPAAGLKERPPYKVGVDGRENYPSNRGFASSAPEQLKPGQIIDRYGSSKGTFAAPAGTPLNQRALPPGAATQGYGMYQVQKPITATTGPAKPAFGQTGKGKQYEMPKPIGQLTKEGVVTRFPPDPVPADEKKKKLEKSEKVAKTEAPPQ